MKLGINTGARGTMGTREAYKSVAQLAERIGFDFISVSDHVVVPAQIGSTYPYSEGGIWETATPDGYSLEQLTTLAFLAGCTEKLQLVTSVTVIPHRPALLTAKILATADQLSIDIYLRKGRPVGEAWKVLKNLGIGQHVDIGKLDTQGFQSFRGAAGEAALRQLRGTLHINNDGVGFDLLLNTLKDVH